MSVFSACPEGLLSEWGQCFVRPDSDVVADLESFYRLLLKWQKVQNLVSRETLGEYWTRHVVDSLQALERILPTDRVIFDLGSGGGFPAIPLATALRDGPNQFHLVESNGRKVSFLKTAARELKLNVRVHSSRIEALDSRETGRADLVMSRALAPLNQLFFYAKPLLTPQGRLLFHKGREYVEELHESGAAWQFDVVVIASKTDADGVLLEISNLQPK